MTTLPRIPKAHPSIEVFGCFLLVQEDGWNEETFRTTA